MPNAQNPAPSKEGEPAPTGPAVGSKVPGNKDFTVTGTPTLVNGRYEIPTTQRAIPVMYVDATSHKPVNGATNPKDVLPSEGTPTNGVAKPGEVVPGNKDYQVSGHPTFVNGR